MKYFRYLLLAVCCGAFAMVTGVGADDDEEVRRIEVSGVGSVSSKPDLALASLGVRTFAKSVQLAVSENNSTAESVLTALASAGIEPHRIETSSYNVSAQRDFRRDKPDTVVGYWASNMVTVGIVELDRVGAVLQSAIDAGANNISNLRFTLEDPEPVKSQARANAVIDARLRAQTLAAAADVKLGEVVSIREMAGRTTVFKDQRMMLESASAEAVPIRVDELKVSIQVEMTFRIE